MKNIQSTGINLIAFLFIFVSVASCSHTPLTPSQTVQNFWSAAISGDVNSIKEFSTPESHPALEELQREYTSASVTFGKVSIESDSAKIETTLVTTNDSRKNSSTTFETYLNRHDKIWKVDYPATRKSLDDARQKKGLSQLVEDLKKFGSDLSGQMEGVIKHWEEASPQIKKDLEQLGSSVQKQLQESIDKHGPELQKKLQEFTESLDDAIKDLQKSLPKDKNKDQLEDNQAPEGRLI